MVSLEILGFFTLFVTLEDREGLLVYSVSPGISV